jgi:hypothetical protein
VDKKRSAFSSGLFRGGLFGPFAARLCLFAILFNQFAPFSEIAAYRAAPADEPFICHYAAGEAPGRHGPPANPHERLAPHCPLCLLFGGTLWAPPGAAPELAYTASEIPGALRAGEHHLPAALAQNLSGRPRGPPASA